MSSHGFEISIAGGVGEMVRAYLLVTFFSSFFLFSFYNHSLFVSRDKKPYAA